MTGLAHLTPYQRQLLVDLYRHREAVAGASGYRFRGQPAPINRASVDALLDRKLAQEVPGRGAVRLRLSPEGILLAAEASARPLKRRAAK